MLTLIVISAWLVLPSLIPSSIIPSWIPYKRIVLGLDLQGGVHLGLEANTDVLFTDQSNQYASKLKKAFLKEKIGYRQLRFDQRRISFELQAEEQKDKMQEVAHKILGNAMACEIHEKRVSFSYDRRVQHELQRQALEKCVEVIRRRVDETGTVEPLIQTQGDRHIILQIPGSQNPVRKLLP